ncbi:MAG: hypothetical protein IJU65_04260 [Desulfovibrio sp.]|nr:hypothetical protein [Desulfovibrio sp.]
MAADPTNSEVVAALTESVTALQDAQQTVIDVKTRVVEAEKNLGKNTVLTTGDQTIEGVKSFTSPVAVGTATADGHAMTKKQMETAISGVSGDAAQAKSDAAAAVTTANAAKSVADNAAATASTAASDASTALATANSAANTASAAQSAATQAQQAAEAAQTAAEEAAEGGGGGATLLGTPAIGMGSVLAAGQQTSITLTESNTKYAATDYFLVSVNNGSEIQVAASNGTGTYTFTPAGNTGDTVEVTARTVDVLGNKSRKATATAEIVEVSIAAAVITSPANNEQNVALAPVITLQAMSVIGGSDTASKVRVQVASDASFSTIVWDSGEITPSTSVTVGQALGRDTDYYVRAYWKGQTYGVGPWSNVVQIHTLDAQVLGVCQATTGAAGQSFTRIDMEGNTLSTNPVFSNHPIYANITEVTVDSQYMVRFPKFWVKREALASGANVGKDARLVSDVALPGYDIHPAFLAQDGSTALDYVLVGKYQGSDGGSSKLASVPGKAPKVSIDFTTMQTWCNNRNTGGVSGFHLWNVWEWSMIDLLMLIEYAGTDFQTLIGRGHVDNSPSGVQNVDHATVAQASWRGLVGLWGNIWQMCDGFRYGASYLEMDMGSGYVVTNVASPQDGSWLYPNTMRKEKGTGWSFEHLFISGTDYATADTSAAYPDGQIFSKNCVLYFGGHYDNAAGSGPFYARVFYNATRSPSSFGGRLAKW